MSKKTIRALVKRTPTYDVYVSNDATTVYLQWLNDVGRIALRACFTIFAPMITEADAFYWFINYEDNLSTILDTLESLHANVRTELYP